MKVKDIAAVIEKIAPLRLAQGWDNVGLLIGSSRQDVKRILLTIDVTGLVLAEAKRLRTDLIVSYHPVIWGALKKVPADGPASVVHNLIRAGIAVFSIHTALDAVAGGVNDGLAEIVGIADATPIGDFVETTLSDMYKLVVFVPINAVAKVSDAVFAAGAGAIGNYSNCSFYTQGTGTFLPLEGARPAIGKKGRLEKTPEVRFETIVPAERLDDCIAAMKKAHPYETPAFDCIKLYNPQAKFGLGRIGKLVQPSRIEQIIRKLKRHTGAQAVGIIGDAKKSVKTAAVCAGSCGELINSVIAARIDLYVTGEIKHHQALAAQEAGLTCICLSHTVSERFMLKNLARQLQKQLKQVTIRVSKKDAEPFRWKNV